MHDIKLIRKDPNAFKEKLKSRDSNLDFDSLLKLDVQNRELIQKKEKLEQEKKVISKKQDTKEFSRSKDISKKIDELDKQQFDIKQKISSIIKYKA